MDKAMKQHEIAELLGVDRTTVTAYQRQGLPHAAGARGQSSVFDGPVVMFWKHGRELVKRRGLPSLPAVTTVLIAYLHILEDEPYEFWHPRAQDLAVRAGATDGDVQRYIDQALAILGRTGR